MILDDYAPCECSSTDCLNKYRANNVQTLMYYKTSDIPDRCPRCNSEGTLRPVKLIHLVYPSDVGPIRTSSQSNVPDKKKHFSFYCQKGNDEFDVKNYIPMHTTDPMATTCPECLVQYNKMLELADNILRAKE